MPMYYCSFNILKYCSYFLYAVISFLLLICSGIIVLTFGMWGYCSLRSHEDVDACNVALMLGGDGQTDARAVTRGID